MLLEYLVFENERWTHSAFCHDVRRTAQALQAEYGVAKGTRVALAMQNYPELLLTMMAVSSLGGNRCFSQCVVDDERA